MVSIAFNNGTFWGSLEDLRNGLNERKVVNTYGWHLLRVDVQQEQAKDLENDVSWCRASAVLCWCETGLPAHCNKNRATGAINDLMTPDFSVHCIANTTPNLSHTYPAFVRRK